MADQTEANAAVLNVLLAIQEAYVQAPPIAEAGGNDGTYDNTLHRAVRDLSIQMLRGTEPGKASWAQYFSVAHAQALCQEDPVELRGSLLKMAALLVAWIKDIDRRLA